MKNLASKSLMHIITACMLIILYSSSTLAGSPAEQEQTPESGSLVIPGETDNSGNEKKQCLNVCKKWGEDCMVNPRTGARQCRRTCKEFGEECF